MNTKPKRLTTRSFQASDNQWRMVEEIRRHYNLRSKGEATRVAIVNEFKKIKGEKK